MQTAAAGAATWRQPFHHFDEAIIKIEEALKVVCQQSRLGLVVIVAPVLSLPLLALTVQFLCCCCCCCCCLRRNCIVAIAHVIKELKKKKKKKKKELYEGIPRLNLADSYSLSLFPSLAQCACSPLFLRRFQPLFLLSFAPAAPLYIFALFLLFIFRCRRKLYTVHCTYVRTWGRVDERAVFIGCSKLQYTVYSSSLV